MHGFARQHLCGRKCSRRNLGTHLVTSTIRGRTVNVVDIFATLARGCERQDNNAQKIAFEPPHIMVLGDWHHHSTRYASMAVRSKTEAPLIRGLER